MSGVTGSCSAASRISRPTSSAARRQDCARASFGRAAAYHDVWAAHGVGIARICATVAIAMIVALTAGAADRTAGVITPDGSPL
jgi:hypothetical protein